MIGYVYLLHFARPMGNAANARAQAQHYIGWAIDPDKREAEHRAGRGAALTRAAIAAGITWELFVLGPGDRHMERKVKNLRATPRLCPLCGRHHPGGRLHMPKHYQLELNLDEDWPKPTAPVRLDWFEISYIRNANLNGYHGTAPTVELPDIPW
jgi:hypothetical protein